MSAAVRLIFWWRVYAFATMLMRGWVLSGTVFVAVLCHGCIILNYYVMTALQGGRIVDGGWFCSIVSLSGDIVSFGLLADIVNILPQG